MKWARSIIRCKEAKKHTKTPKNQTHTDRSRDCDFPRDGIGMFHHCLAQTQRQEGESDVVQTFSRIFLFLDEN